MREVAYLGAMDAVELLIIICTNYAVRICLGIYRLKERPLVAFLKTECVPILLSMALNGLIRRYTSLDLYFGALGFKVVIL